MRIAPAKIKILAAIMNHDGEVYGLQLSRATKCSTGAVYDILREFVDEGWLEWRWEDAEPSNVKRPRRKLYKLTPVGVAHAAKELEEFRLSFGEVIRWA